jgi:hypothetical protein
MTSKKIDYWIFSNYPAGTYEDSDWDMSTILRKHQYYFKEPERNRSGVKAGDIAYLRIYGVAYIGYFIVGKWNADPESKKKHGVLAGSFEMKEIVQWRRPLPQSLAIRDLSSKDVRSRILWISEADAISINVAQRTYERLGFGGADGEIVVLEKGIEEAIKPNLATLGLSLANKEIAQQFSMGPGVGRSDLICLDEHGDLVVVELKRGLSSDEAIGQVLRYIGYVREAIAKEGQKVSGWIVAGDYDEHLRLAASAAGIRLLVVRLG